MGELVMKKSCSNCKFNKDNYCKKHNFRIFLTEVCPDWKRKSTTKQFYDKKRRQKTRKKSIKQEKQVAKEVGGRRQPMSGAGYHKGDVKSELRLIETKFTGKKSYALKRRDLEKIFYESICEESEIPCFWLKMGKTNYCILLKDDLEAIIEELKESRK